MVRDNKTVSVRFSKVAGPAFRIFKRLIASFRDAASLLAAAWEISHAANRHVTHSALKQITDSIYRRHGILTAALWLDEGAKSTMAQESEVSVEECLVISQAELKGAKV